tara:strand:+ start:281 stop:505 length:225 start_codon:yes stop_codon:yes gene_type:complete
MATITLRSAKGSPLTNSEVDTNFTNLNNAKIEVSNSPSEGDSLKYESGAFKATATQTSGVSLATTVGIAIVFGS